MIKLKCPAPGCERPGIKQYKAGTNPHEYCVVHKKRWQNHGHINPTRQPDGQWRHKDENGYVKIKVDGRAKYEHIHLAEKALGKKLPKGAVVHHMNENRSDNFTYFNLVVCPSKGYHAHLHQRMKQLNARNKNS